MQRDMELVRDILMGVAGADGDMDARAFASEQHDYQIVAYHFEIMDEAGLVEALIQKDFSGGYCMARVERLTWDGNEFLSAISNGKVWKSVKMRMAQKSIDAPLEIVRQLAVSACASILGI